MLVLHVLLFSIATFFDLSLTLLSLVEVNVLHLDELLELLDLSVV